MLKIRELDNNFLLKWPYYANIVNEWQDVKCLMAMDLNVPVGLLVASGGRVLHMFVRVGERRGGIGKTLLNYFMTTNKDRGVETTVLVSSSNTEALCFFIHCGLVYWGKGIYKDTKGILLRSERPAPKSKDQIADRERLLSSIGEDMLGKILVMEVPPSVL